MCVPRQAFLRRCLECGHVTAHVYAPAAPETATPYGLTRREIDVIATVIRLGDQQLAARALGLSYGSLKTALWSVHRKTGSPTTPAAAARLLPYIDHLVGPLVGAPARHPMFDAVRTDRYLADHPTSALEAAERATLRAARRCSRRRRVA